MTRLHTVKALEQILSLGGASARIFDYGADFNAIWNLDSLQDLEHAIVVWADTPVDPDVHPVTTEHYLTPFDWAIVACAKHHKLRVTVLDLRSGEHDEADMNASKEQKDAPYAALRWYRTQRPGCVPWLRRLGIKDLVDVANLDDLVTTLTKTAGNGEPIVTAREALRMLPICHLDLSERADHHAIANLVGPLVLLDRVSRPFATPGQSKGHSANHRQALHQMLATAGFVPEPRACPGAGESSAAAGNSFPFAPSDNVRIVLLDDQWHQGWGEWVCKMVGVPFVPVAGLSQRPQRISGAGRVEVFAAHDPGWLIGRLSGSDKRFRLSVTDSQKPAQDILLMDLRLFTGRDSQEEPFLARLRPLCKRFESGKHAWRGITQAEAEATAGTSIARSLLPRLVALTDLSMPIVLFSSTADRQFVEHFRDYGNIITTFAKPRLLGNRYAQEETTSAFRAALQDASSLSAGRFFVRRLLEVAEEAKATARSFLSADNGDAAKAGEKAGTQPWTYAELYLDESGKEEGQWFKAGGYIALHKDEASVKNVTFGTKTWGFSRDEPFSTRASIDYWKKASGLWSAARGNGNQEQQVKAELQERARVAKEAIENAGGRLAACLIRKAQAEVLPGPDATYRAMAAAIIEFFLFDWLPALEHAAQLSPGTMKAGVFLGTRQWVTEAENVIKNQWNYGLAINILRRGNIPPNAKRVKPDPTENLEPSVGYNSKDGLALSAGGSDFAIAGTSMGSGDAYPLVVAIAQQRGLSSVDYRLQRAVAVRLDDFDNYLTTDRWPPELPRQIHFASDDFLGGTGERIVQGPLDAGFESEHSPAFAAFLRASRGLDSLSTLPRGLQDLREAMTVAQNKELESPLRWVAIRCEALLSQMSGMDFMQFARGLVVLRDPAAGTAAGRLTAKRRRRRRQRRGTPARGRPQP